MNAESFINSLSHNQTIQYRLGKHGEHCIQWQPTTNGPVYIAKNNQNQVVTITPINKTWAEFDPRRDIVEITQNSIILNCEEYNMEIFVTWD